MQNPSSTSTWKRGAAAGAGFALLATLVATTGPTSLSASSHREAPLIAGDPRADNTDVYAFVSPDAPDTTTLIASWIPFEEPNGGPNFYPWADGARYNINVDNDGDAVADLAYRWIFSTVEKPGYRDGFLVNVGPFDSVLDDELLTYQTYDLVVSDLNGTPTDESDDTTSLLLDDAISAPSVAGAVSTPDYQALVDEAVDSGSIEVGSLAGLKSYAGQSDDPFFLDLRVFDLLYGANVVPEVGEDTLAGYNVNTIALQVPSAALALNGDATNNPVIGVWSTTDRIVVNTDSNGTPADPTDDIVTQTPVQVSRLGNPLVNEVVLPLALKDAFNSIDPTLDATIPAAVDAVVNPILPGLIELIYGVPAPEGQRSDLVEIFLQGVSVANGGLVGTPDDNPALAADLNDLALNADVASATPSEMLRLNMAVPPSANPSPLGVLGGDLAGFPNGRRLEDDVVDIALAVVEGAVFGEGADVSALAPFDSVDRNDRAFSTSFPYVALPHTDSVVNGTERTPRAPEVISVTPERLLDTRDDDKPEGGDTIELQVAGVGTALVPDDAQAVFLNITATQTEAAGFVTAYACEVARPEASSLNPDPDRIVSGLVPAQMSADGKVCIYTDSSANIIVDVAAYLPSTAAYTSVVPERLLDTREGDTPAADSTTPITVVGVGDAALPADTSAVLVNLTSARTTGDGFLTAYPCGTDLPTASNLNTRTGTNRANLASVKVGADGTICVYSSAGTDFAVDLVGAFPASSSYVAIEPERLVDTRTKVGYTGSKPVAEQVIEVPVRGPGTTVSDDTGTVVLNVTGVAPEATGFFTVFPCGESLPTASNLNLQDLNTAAAVVAKVGDNDRVCVYTQSSAHVIVDLVGYFPGTVLASKAL